MKQTPSSVLWCAVFSLIMGCQPESTSEPTGPLAVNEQAVVEQVGSWARTAPLTSSTPIDNAVLFNTGEVLVQRSIYVDALAERVQPQR